MTAPLGSPPAAGRAPDAPRWALARRTLRPAYAFYYRALYSRQFPGKQKLDGLVLALETRIARGDTPTDKAVWEQKYRAGDWAFMHDLHQVPRYAAIASLAHRLRPGGTILDVGCGEGVLQDHLRPLGYSRYSASMSPRPPSRKPLQPAALTTSRPSLPPTPSTTLRRPVRCDRLQRVRPLLSRRTTSVSVYERFLAPEGVFIISTFRTPRGDAIMRDVLKQYEVLEELAISHRNGTSTLCVLLPTR